MTPSNDISAAYAVGNSTHGYQVQLRTDQITIDHDLESTKPGILIYAETVVIASDITLEAITTELGASVPRNLLICCNSLILGDDRISVNVYGKSQHQAISNQTGADGENGGSITLCVESLEHNQLGHIGDDNKNHGLFLNAWGGEGGMGADMVEEGQAGKDGGNGGNGGTVKIFYGNGAVAAIKVLRQDPPPKEPWAAKARRLQNTLLPGLDEVYKAHAFEPTNLNALSNTVSDYIDLFTACSALQTRLTTMLSLQRPLPAQLKTAGSTLLVELQTMLLSATGPSDSATIRSQAEDLVKDIDTFIQSGLSKSADELVSRINESMSTFNAQPDMQLDNELAAVERDCSTMVANMRTRAKDHSVNSGHGGRPGNGDINVPPGKRGVDGSNGNVFVTELQFSGSAEDLQIDEVIAQPDECQMLLNMADNSFIKGDDSSRILAAGLYSRLTDRLAFVPALMDEGNEETPLYQAYATAEENGLTVNTFTQLQSIYQQAGASLGLILAGRDIFGHDEYWVPRLSYQYFDDRYTELSAHLKEAEEKFSEYEDALNNSRSTKSFLEDSISVADTRAKDAEAQIAMLTDENGPMNTSEFQIGSFTPMLKNKRSEIKAEVAAIISDIQHSLNMDPGHFLDALSAIAIAPEKLNIGVQLLQSGMKTMTEAHSITGEDVNTKYVVSRVAQCGDTIQSLEEGYNTLSDGSIEVDDPGAAKLLMAENDLETLVTEFQSAIPQKDRDTLIKSLNEYISYIKQRNDAVMTYNACIHLLYQAEKDNDYYTAQGKDLKSKKETIDPTLPAITFWLKKSLNDLRLGCLRVLNYGGHALRFWGLVDIPLGFQGDGTFPDSIQINRYKDQLADNKETGLNELSDPTMMIPGDDSNPKRGVFYKLTGGERNVLLEGIKDPDAPGHQIYQVVLQNIVPAYRTSAVDTNPFANCANVRIHQVRVWLPKARVTQPDGIPKLRVDFVQYGDETIVPTQWAPKDRPLSIACRHASVGGWSTYNTTGIDSLDDITKATDMDVQDLAQGCFTNKSKMSAELMAPIGPFATWEITIYGRNHQSVNFDHVDDVWVEFWVTAMKFKDRPDVKS
ncbi:predicted protein [Paecilomyces variotii No. 5]|uniref:Serine protein kinase n=1 Tax=Byssochlamys spectabilis (strain No. 5 / NBRC 109023) TaxID=1356009 RepID=V5FSH3_BYSSN|nr:predicted protein [Paecilomyces variotii No. 5]